MSAPQALDLARHRDLRQRAPGVAARRTALALLAGFLAVALAGVFGAPARTRTAAAPAAILTVEAPDRLRSGLLWQARITIEARRPIAEARLLLSQGWTEGMTVNTIEPQPQSETSEGGALVLEVGRLEAGERFLLQLDFQVEPGWAARRDRRTELHDGERRLVAIGQTMLLYP